jgi:hypothetical protein
MPYLREGFRSWWNVVRFIAYFFSLPVLARTLLSGWRRDSGGEMREWWERLIISGIIITIGLLIRLVVISFGLVALLCSLFLLPALAFCRRRISCQLKTGAPQNQLFERVRLKIKLFFEG